TILKVARRGSIDTYPTSASIDASQIRHLIINGGWRIWSRDSLDEALSGLPTLPTLKILRLHYMTWDNVSDTSKAILTSSFSSIVQLELSRFGCETLKELVEILLSFPHLQSLSLDELGETGEERVAVPGFGNTPPFQHLTSLHVSLSYAAYFLSWFLRIEPLPPVSRLSLGGIADSFPVEPDDEPWQDRGILKREEAALASCKRLFSGQLEHIVYRGRGTYGQLHFPALRTLEANVWALQSSLYGSTFENLSTIILHLDNLTPVLGYTRPLRNIGRLLATPPLRSVLNFRIIIQEWAVYPRSVNEQGVASETEKDIRRELGPEFEERGGTLGLSWSSVGRSWGKSLDS
ncbi:hypothetical protein B0H11DRAFT_2141217, partial [Mycena galericulata]